MVVREGGTNREFVLEGADEDGNSLSTLLPMYHLPDAFPFDVAII